jgi:hypothetical protein
VTARTIIARVPRAVAAALIGALVGPALLVFTYTINPGIRIDFGGGATPAVLSGFYPAERGDRGLTFAWTRTRATIRLPGLGRETEWDVRIRYRGARPDLATLPDLTFAIDGKAALRRKASNAFAEARLTLPAAGGEIDGATIVITAEPGFTPGPNDPRVLGIVVDEITITPATRIVLPPRRTIASAATAAALFGAGFGLVGVTPGTAIGSAILVSAAQAPALAAGIAPYTPYAERAATLAAWIAMLMAAWGIALERVRRAPLRNTARFVIAFSAGALYLKLLVLLHPQMPIVDAMFQAHRFEWVLSGRYYFTQPMPGGVEFPYAIALYVFAAPWSAFTRDYMTLLRIVVCASQAVAGALLYPMVVRIRGDRLAGAAAVLLFHLAPLPFLVIGNGNLTYAFGQSAALATVAAVVILRLGTRDLLAVAGLSLLASVAFLSHVGIAPLLLTALVVVAIFYGAFGDRTMHSAARSVLVATAVAVVLSTVSYYGHFGDAYRTLAKVRTQPQTTVGAAGTEATTPASSEAVPLTVRTVQAVRLAVRALGWPILVLAFLGAWWLWREGARDRLTLVVAALGVTCLVFVAFRVAAPVDRVFQRYADEFIDRVNYAALPVVAVLGGFGASWAWRAGVTLRAVAAVLLSAAVWGATTIWLGWIR